MEKVADKEEYVMVLDENGNSLNYLEKRSVVHNNKLFHNEIALWVINKDNKTVLLQRRSPNKKQNPNKLGLCAGHVVENETIMEALYKEAKEEIGVDLNKFEVKPITVLKRTEPSNHCFSHHYYIVANLPVESFIIQQDEVSEVLYMDYEKLKNMVKEHNDDVVFKNYELYKNVFDVLDNIIYN